MGYHLRWTAAYSRFTVRLYVIDVRPKHFCFFNFYNFDMCSKFFPKSVEPMCHPIVFPVKHNFKGCSVQQLLTTVANAKKRHITVPNSRYETIPHSCFCFFLTSLSWLSSNELSRIDHISQRRTCSTTNSGYANAARINGHVASSQTAL